MLTFVLGHSHFVLCDGRWKIQKQMLPLYLQMKLEETEGMLEQKTKALETQLLSNNDLNSSIQNMKDQLSEKLATSDQLGSRCDHLQKLLDDATEEIEALKSVSEQILQSPIFFTIVALCPFNFHSLQRPFGLSDSGIV